MRLRKTCKDQGALFGDKNLHNAGMQGEGGGGVLNNAIWRRGVAALCRLCRILPPYTPTPTPLDPYSRTISCNRMLIGKYWWDPPYPFFHPLRVLEFIYRTYVRKRVRTAYISCHIGFSYPFLTSLINAFLLNFPISFGPVFQEYFHPFLRLCC